MVASGDTVASADVNLAQQRNAGPSTLGVADIAANNFTAEAIIETITVPVVSGRKYRVSYMFNVLASGSGNTLYVRLRETNVSGVQINYVQHQPAVTPIIDSRSFYTEWTAASTGNQTFVATVIRNSGAATSTFKGSAGQPRILSVEWLGANA